MSVLDRILGIGGLILSAALIVGVPFFIRGWVRKLASVVLGIALFVAMVILGYPGYRRQLDETRVANVEEIYKVIERFKNSTGRCPLEQLLNGAPIGVNISRRPLPDQYRRPPPGAPGSIVPYEDFLAELRTGLKSDVELPLDPQKVPFGPPLFYQYHLSGSRFIVAASLWFDRPGAKQLGWYYYKFELHGSCRTSGGP